MFRVEIWKAGTVEPTGYAEDADRTAAVLKAARTIGMKLPAIGNSEHFPGGKTWHFQFTRGYDRKVGGAMLSATYIAHVEEVS